MATIADVAREAGVSVSTVSHVVNGTRRVSPATASAVKAVIDALGYHPNVVARSLKTASTQSVGIAISAIANPYFSDIICAIETECARLGMMVFLSDTQDDPARELAVVTALHQRRVDGVILAPSADPERRALVYLHAKRLPCVLVDRTPDPRSIRSASTIARRCASWSIMSPGSGTAASAMSAAIRALRPRSSASSATATVCSDWASSINERHLVTGNASTASAAGATHALLSLPEPPTALVTGNNMATIGAMRAIRALGLTVPDDISIAGFDDFEWADCFEPRLTLIAQPCEEIGRRAAFLLMERIAAPDGARRTLRLDAASSFAPPVRGRGERARRNGAPAARHDAASTRALAASRRCAASTSTFARAKSMRCSARTAPANRR